MTKEQEEAIKALKTVARSLEDVDMKVRKCGSDYIFLGTIINNIGTMLRNIATEIEHR